MDLFYGRVSGKSARSAFRLYEAGGQSTPRLLNTRSGENRTLAWLERLRARPAWRKAAAPVFGS